MPRYDEILRDYSEERPLTREEAVVLASLGYEGTVESTGE